MMLGEKPASRQRVSQWNADASRLEADELNVVMPSVVERRSRSVIVTPIFTP